jgi:hypothetical protein
MTLTRRDRAILTTAAVLAVGGCGTALWTTANAPATYAADETWTDTVIPPAPTKGEVSDPDENPTNVNPTPARTYAAGEGAPRTDWAACVVTALTTPGMGGDADMIACDNAYTAATGDTATLWLWCPGPPEQGGCRAEDGPYPVEDPNYDPTAPAPTHRWDDYTNPQDAAADQRQRDLWNNEQDIDPTADPTNVNPAPEAIAPTDEPTATPEG